MLVTASIVTYKNKKEVLDAAVTSFLNTGMDVFLYIIDNSPDDTIRQWYNDPRVEYIYNKISTEPNAKIYDKYYLYALIIREIFA